MVNKLFKSCFGIILIMGFFCLIAALSIGQDEQPAQPPPTIVFAPSGTPVSAVTAKEQYRLGREYQYGTKQKNIITSPYLTAPGEGPEVTPEETETLNEQEKLYRYFGIATELYKAGRIEEAVELLEYITLKRPDDRYLQNYLFNLKKEANLKKEKWTKSYKKDAEILKRIKIKNLTEEGLAYYKQKKFDRALVTFSDLLVLDPDNGISKKYINKLKTHYRKEIKIENIVQNWMNDVGKEAEGSQESIVDKLFIEAELKESGVTPKVEKTAENLLDKEETKQLVMDKKAAMFLNEAQYDAGTEEIIEKWREEEKKSSVLTLGPGDKLQISVRDHPELSGTTTVSIKGTIILPLTNDVVKIQGMTLDETRNEVIDVMKRYVKEPVVNVTIVEYKSKVFYVIDEFGAYPYNITRANFTLRDALFTADWGDNRALGRIIVMKPDKFNPIIKKVDGFDIIYRGKLANNIKIENGDVIYIPMTAASKITKVITDTLSPIKALRDLRDEWLDGRWNKTGWTNLPRMPIDQEQEREWRAESAETQ